MNSNGISDSLALKLEPEAIAKARRDAEQKAASLTTDQYNYTRKLCKNNLFFLSKTILGYDWLSDELHGDYCRWKARTDTLFRFRLTLLPRGHLKSTIDTISDSIRCVLPDDSNAAPYPECLGPEMRLMLGHETEMGASSFLDAISGHFLSNPLLMGLFPECIPTKGKQRINSFQLELPRKRKWPQPTIDTMGVGAKAQGRHYNKIKLDDIIGDKARESKREMETAISWVNGIQSFFSSFLQDEIDWVGTRWAFDDVYAHIMKMYGDQLGKYIRSAIEKDKDGKDKVIFPERKVSGVVVGFSIKGYEIIKKDPKIWNANYANNPGLIDSAFLPGWLRYFNYRGPNRVVIFNRDLNGVIKVEEYGIMTQMDRVILVDPATSGNSGIIVTGMTANERIFTLEAIKSSLRPPELTEKIFQLVSKYQPRTVAIEEVLFSEVYRPWWQREMILRGIRFHITPVRPETRSKGARIRGLANYYGAGNMYHSQEQTDLIDEFRTLGASIEDKHLLDALAYGPKVWSKPFNIQQTTQSDNMPDPRLHVIPSTGY